MKKQIKKAYKILGIIIFICITSVIVVLLFANWKIPHDTKKYIYSDVNKIPHQKVGLVLGTAKYIGYHLNPYFSNRMRAAKELYDAGKVEAFIVSGDNRNESYNEPEDMRQALIEMGVPDSIIYLDYAGLRTLDSVVRAKRVFGQDSVIVISQQFHNERAIFLSHYYGIKAYGYNAKDVKINRVSIRTKIREKFARVKVFVDIITNKKPVYLGEPVKIN